MARITQELVKQLKQEKEVRIFPFQRHELSKIEKMAIQAPRVRQGTAHSNIHHGNAVNFWGKQGTGLQLIYLKHFNQPTHSQYEVCCARQPWRLTKLTGSITSLVEIKIFYKKTNTHLCLSIFQTTETTDSKEWEVPQASPAGRMEEHQSQEQLISQKDSPTCQATLQNETEAKNSDIWDHTNRYLPLLVSFSQPNTNQSCEKGLSTEWYQVGWGCVCGMFFFITD